MNEALRLVYQSSFAWACLGSRVRAFACGQAVYNEAHPDYHENNCFWHLTGDRLETQVAAVEHFYRQHKLECYNWVPDLEADLPRLTRFFRAHGLHDEPSAALLLETRPAARSVTESIPRSATPRTPAVALVPATPDLLAHVYALSGQRWTGETVKNKALSLLGVAGYESYVGVLETPSGGQVVGRVGLLRGQGENPQVARLKSLFVGAAFRQRGIAQTLMHAVSARSYALGYDFLASEVALDNPPSLRAHAAAGFQQVGVMHCFANAR